MKKVAYRLRGREKLLVPLMVFIFSLSGATFGLSEETIIFVPIVGAQLLLGAGFLVLATMIDYGPF